MPQSRQRKTSTRNRTKKSSRRKPAGDYTLNWVGAGFTLVGGLALTRLGMLGVSLANVFRIFSGDSFYLLTALITVWALFLLFTGHFPQVAKRVIFGGGIAYIGLLLMLSARTMAAANVHAHFVAATWQILRSDFSLLTTETSSGGGIVGAIIYSLTYPLLTQVGSYIIAILLLIAGGMLIFDVHPNQVFSVLQKCASATKTGFSRLSTILADFRNRQMTPAQGAKAGHKHAAAATAGQTAEDKDLPTPLAQQTPLRGQVDTPEPDDFHINVPESETATPVVPVSQPAVSAKPEQDDGPDLDLETGDPEADYQLPGLDLLSEPKPVDQSEEYAKIKANRSKLESTFASFGVDVTVKAASLGPSITKYEIQPAVGVKVSKIVNLSDDLALALAAKDIRIEAPIPGKSLIGIEVPNQHVATVGFKEVFKAMPKHPSKPLVVPLGKDVSGKIVAADLAKMPHLLIAGATGSGKSVMINVIITSILMSTKPTDVRLMLIDPKKVELSIYDGVPHLLAPVVTEAKRAPGALNKILEEMNRRYERFSAAGVRNMDEYNKKVAEEPDEGLSKMPYIVVIVDELADLMMVAGAEVETAIIRIGQMARAAGIHMIIATQRPSVDVITGLIKANIPSRIAFAVSSGVDSRTIIDMNGAERLLGRGDMLYSPIDMNKPERVQGAFIPSEDVENVVEFITDQVKPAYDEAMIPTEADEVDNKSDSDDELFDDALAFVAEKQSASTSMLQRRFRIGYNRAARLIDDLENRGYVGPSEGSKPRKVYAKPKDDQPQQGN
ncbi:DNA translocase FtsK [Lacticaseibacillus pabuli]|uniref:DNA translocase FtsK n=1 Tax=Lacticaseibacillus pabuli TaxID=3025672 RepID=A0ABY7WP98_9LACO|nr:DNA translocase FtsK [Lacticaseibacillus sp. KACC 23028]WDF82008.1 DNA translocase FtsK [Lacticaseibacillus sp. KACC 23028]